MLSILDVFRVGIGPSSSHTVGPIRIARRFLSGLQRENILDQTASIRVTLQGSLALTGKGHATPKAVILGLLGLRPETLDPIQSDRDVAAVYRMRKLNLMGVEPISFDPEKDIVFDYETVPDLHPNGMQLIAYNAAGKKLCEKTFYSTGGGFIATHKQLSKPSSNDRINAGHTVPYDFDSAAELLSCANKNGLELHQVVLRNEDAIRSRADTEKSLDRIFHVMMASIDRGLSGVGTLPGGLKVRRRAKLLWEKLQANGFSNEREELFDWLNVYAMAVNEENAAGSQVVTAPTNGAAGIIPSILRHYCYEDETQARIFLLTAGGIGLLYKQRASISGAEMGCQGEVGVACSMAAGGLAAIWGGTAQQIASAAEIGMEHNLGLTCDPVGGLVQIPCIERNAIGAVKAVNAARLSLHGDGRTKVSLDQVIETMRQTGLDMSSKYKETSLGGLAVNVVEC